MTVESLHEQDKQGRQKNDRKMEARIMFHGILLTTSFRPWKSSIGHLMEFLKVVSDYT